MDRAASQRAEMLTSLQQRTHEKNGIKLRAAHPIHKS